MHVKYIILKSFSVNKIVPNFYDGINNINALQREDYYFQMSDT